MAAQMQKLELRTQELESAAAQLSARADGLAHVVQVSAGTGGTGAVPNAGTSVLQVAVDTLRADLERESSGRQAQGNDSHDRFKEVHSLLGQLANRLDTDTARRQQQLENDEKMQQAQLSSVEPEVAALRSEMDILREGLRRSTS